MVELPEEENLDALIRLSAQVREIFQGEWGHPNLVALNAKDFPDPFIGDADSGVLFMAQMQRHSGLTDIPVKVEFFGDNMVSGGSCSSGACGSSSAPLTKPELRDVDGTWHLLIPQAYLGSPVAFAWLASTTLAQIFCVESLEYGKSLPEPRAAVIEMVACQLGFGGILLEASHIYSKYLHLFSKKLNS